MSSTITPTTPNPADVNLPSTAPADAVQPITAEQAFFTKKAEILAHSDAGTPRNVDVPRAVSHALAACARLEPLVDEMVRVSAHRGHRDRAIVDTEIGHRGHRDRPSWTPRSADQRIRQAVTRLA